MNVDVVVTRYETCEVHVGNSCCGHTKTERSSSGKILTERLTLPWSECIKITSNNEIDWVKYYDVKKEYNHFGCKLCKNGNDCMYDLFTMDEIITITFTVSLADYISLYDKVERLAEIVDALSLDKIRKLNEHNQTFNVHSKPFEPK